MTYNIKQIIEVVLFQTVEADSADEAHDTVVEYGIDDAIVHCDEYYELDTTVEIQE
tara:strand:+ start:1806 stop:1973 length:168 start_codon:yes stop_codon:yes gene_type:complete